MIEQVRFAVEKQRAFYNTHKTKDITFRILQLKTLKKAIIAYEERLYEALWKDLHKSKFEAYATEIGLVLPGKQLARNTASSKTHRFKIISQTPIIINQHSHQQAPGQR